jgi:hypothetical protein
MTARDPQRSGPGLHVRRLELQGASHPELGPRFAAALDAQLAQRGLHRVEIGRLRLDARGLAAGDAGGIDRLASRVADALGQRTGGREP